MERRSMADRVRRARTAAGLTQAELAQRIGTTQSAVSRLESGRLLPTLAVLERVATATGRPITIVLGPDGAVQARSPDPVRRPQPPGGRPLPSSSRRNA